jgi:uncharacterized coiled-coil protein SlyX
MSDHGDNSRLERLEDAQMFAERRADLLSEQMVALEQKLREFAERMRRLEEGLGRLGEVVEKRTDDESGDLP